MIYTLNDTQVVQALAALAQESRLRVFRMLVVAGPGGATPSQISASLAIAPTALSFHLKELTRAGLLTQERDGRYLIYRTHIETMNALLNFLTAECCHGLACLDDPFCHVPKANGKESRILGGCDGTI